MHTARDSFKEADGQQAGDPYKVADTFIALAGNPAPPARVFLGAVAWQAAQATLAQQAQALEQNKDLAFSIDFGA